MKRGWIAWLAVLIICMSGFAVWHTFSAQPSIAASASGPARSVIFFIGDGMGPQIVSIAKVYVEGVLNSDLNMVKLANSGATGFMTTHAADRVITDSAASGTAMAAGSKTNNGMVGVSPEGVELKNLF